MWLHFEVDVHHHDDWTFSDLDADTSSLDETELLRAAINHDRRVFEHRYHVVLQDVLVKF